MTGSQLIRFKTISEFHRYRGLPGPEHPLISVINLETVTHLMPLETSIVKDFYSIALKRNFNVKMKYGQSTYDFNEGTMFFMSPGQVLRLEGGATTLKQTGWMLLVHPDYFRNSPLAKTIGHYDYFDYSVNEALFLSEKEETTIVNILQNIKQEYSSNIDKFSQDIIIAQLEVFLNYCERFYNRQFITRKIGNDQVLDRLEKLLKDYFNSNALAQKGVPTVQFIADALNVSPNYLSSMLKVLTGKSTQQHIHDLLIEKAKEKLSTTQLSASEIAYELGFEHPQSFSKLFKTKTKLSPLEFRASFN